jgi:uroporphyrinogen-III synthase
MQPNNISILCTRPLSRELIHMAGQMGFRIDIVPFIKTEQFDSEELATRIQSLSLQTITAAFTSINAAEAVICQLNGFKPLWRIFCLGNTTRDTLVQYFGQEAIAGFANNASLLADTIIKAGNAGDIVFFCGDQRRDELPSILISNRIAVEEVTVYRTITLANNIDREYQGILFFSPSAVAGFFSKNTIPVQTILFAIGETTAATIKKYTNNIIIVADEASKEDLVNKMIKYYQVLDQEKISNRN